MADNTFRTSRRDAVAPGGPQTEDPLAELARLIGQNPPASNAADRGVQQYDAPPLDAQEADQQWAADARYAEQYAEQHGDRQSQYGDSRYDESQYSDSQPSESHDAPQLADPYPPPYRAAPPSYNTEGEQSDQYASAQQYDTRGYADQPRYDDEHDPVQDLPAFLPRLREGSADAVPERALDRGRAQTFAQNYGQENYGQSDDSQGGQGGYDQNYSQQDYDPAYALNQEGDPDDQSYALEDYEEEDEAPAPRRRRGLAIAAALLGVIVLGTAGAFGYRAMFGGSLMPSLPPIIKADGTPNKIIPAGNSANSSGQATASTGGDKLVSREEKPVDVPAPAATPRVVSTIPVFPDPNAGLQSSVVPGAPNMANQNMPGAVANGLAGGGAPGGAMSPLGPTAAPVYGGAGVAPAGFPPGAAPQGSAMPTQPPVAGTANSKKIHTLAIHTGAQDNADNSVAAAPAQTQDAPAPAAPPRATQTARPVPPKPVPSAPQGGGQGGPMSIVPSQSGGDTTTRTALARPTQAAEPAPSSHGTFVQVTSRRSEAEAQAEYRNLQAKYPSQLGGHTSTVRQVSLGDKGTFYRALVGPFASMEQATQMCSSLKAAGGNCIVQRN